MRILDRYIINSVIKSFFAIMLIFCLLYVLIDITSNLDELIERKVGFNILLQYYMASLPFILTQIAPFGCLLAVIFTYNHLNNNNEIIAIRTSGLNFWQIARPALIFTILISVILFLVNEKLVPESSQRAKNIKSENMIMISDEMAAQKEKIKNLTFYGLNSRLYFVDWFDPKNSELNGITIIEHDQTQNIRQKTVALKGVWTGIAWKFFNCQMTLYDENNNTPIKVKMFNEKLMDIKETPEDFFKQRVHVSSMNIRQLNEYIQRFAKSGATRALDNLKVDLYQKIAYPLMSIVIVLIGMPFALLVKGRQRSTFTCFGLAILIGFLYYVSNAVALAFGKGGMLWPMIAAFLIPIGFGWGAVYLIRKNF